MTNPERDVVAEVREWLAKYDRADYGTRAGMWRISGDYTLSWLRALVTRCKQAEQERDRLKAENAADVQRLLDDVLYMEGIAVRGFGQPTPEDVPIRAYVLQYVQRLEAENERLKVQETLIKEDWYPAGISPDNTPDFACVFCGVLRSSVLTGRVSHPEWCDLFKSKSQRLRGLMLCNVPALITQVQQETKDHILAAHEQDLEAAFLAGFDDVGTSPSAALARFMASRKGGKERLGLSENLLVIPEREKGGSDDQG